MMMRIGAMLALGLTTGACVYIEDTGPPARTLSPTAELRELRAKDEIRELIHAYGRTLDARDFAGFAALWAEDAAYVGGGAGGAPVVGPEAIAGQLEAIFAANPSGLEGPTAHLFFNEHIEVDGDRATGVSLGAFVAQPPGGEGGAFEMVILARYEDVYVIEDGRWKFARRVVRGL